MSDIQRDREERQHVIEVLKSWDGYFIGYTSDEVQEALRYAIASIKTDLKYDLLYEETSGQADKPTTKKDLAVDAVSRAEVLKLMQDNWHTHNGDWAMQESMDDIRALPSVTPQEPRWILVSERLPDTDDEVLCWYEYYHWSLEKVLPEYGLGRYLIETSSWFGEVANGHKVRVIAWMPLPKAYREVEE